MPIHDFFTSELKLCLSNYVIITVSDNAKLLSFEYDKGCPSLTRSTSNRSAPTLGSNKKDHRWGETPSLNCQWDSISRPAIADSANATDTFSNEVLHLSPSSLRAFSLRSTTTARDRSSSMKIMLEKILSLEVRADQALLTGTTDLAHRQKYFETNQTDAPRPKMMDSRYQRNSMPSLLLATRPGEKSRSNKKRPPRYTCDNKRAGNIIKGVQQLEHRTTMEIKLKGGGNGPPQQPRRRNSIYSKAA